MLPRNIGRTKEAFNFAFQLSKKREDNVYFYVDHISKDIHDLAQSITYNAKVSVMGDSVVNIQINNFSIVRFNQDTFDFNLFIERGRQLPGKGNVIVDHKIIEWYITKIYNAINEFVSGTPTLKNDLINFTKELNNHLLLDFYTQESFFDLMEVWLKMKNKIENN